jgi:putative transposase
VMDETEDGRRLKIMPVVDEYSRECLSIDVERSITAEDVVNTLASLFRQGASRPSSAQAFGPGVHRQNHQEVAGDPLHEPGSPWENAYLRRRSSVAFQTSC